MNEDKKPVCVWRYQKSQSFEGYHVYEPECDRGLGVNCQKKKENGEIDNKCGRPIEVSVTTLLDGRQVARSVYRDLRERKIKNYETL